MTPLSPPFPTEPLHRIAQKHLRIAEFHGVKGSTIRVPTFDRADHLAAAKVIADAIEIHAAEVAELRGEIAYRDARMAALREEVDGLREEAEAAKAMLETLRPLESAIEEIPNVTPA